MTKRIQKCNKPIKIIDPSELGWKTRWEYKIDDIADDLADKKRLKAAEKAIEKAAALKDWQEKGQKDKGGRSP